MGDMRNWAGNLSYSAQRIHRPRTIDEVREVVASATKVRALGTRHSFNDIADTDGDLVSTENLSDVLELDADKRTAKVGAGITYGQLCRRLGREGLAIHNLASLPHISVAGACATATHGSGDRNGNLSTAVEALDLVKADGSLVELRRGRDQEFPGSVVSLGALGVVTALTLTVVPKFEVSQELFENLPLEALRDDFDAVTSSAYSVSLFTDWRRSGFNQVWLKHRGAATGQPTFYGATAARGPLHPISTMSPENCTQQMGIPGPFDERLPHFRLEFTPSAGDELQTEYLVPRRHAFAALSEVDRMRDRIAPLLQISEIRTMAADELWMSPSYGEDCVGIHFTWQPDWNKVREVLPEIEDRFAPFEARPHWGKLFAMKADRLAPLYSRRRDFLELA